MVYIFYLGVFAFAWAEKKKQFWLNTTTVIAMKSSSKMRPSILAPEMFSLQDYSNMSELNKTQ